MNMLALLVIVAAIASSDGCVKTGGGNSNGNCCVFPFHYNGQDYDTCIKINSDKLWCGTTYRYDLEGKWGNCVTDGCKKTEGGNSNGMCCAFPFRYNGQDYNECIKLNSGKSWCGTTYRYDVDGKWGNCLTGVSCGHHRAPKCGGCPQGHGASWCNGDCRWCNSNNNCESKSIVCPAGVSCGTHRATNCADCTRGHGESWCKGECKWCNGKCQAKDACTVNGAWGPWSSYGSCSMTCGGGVQTRNRECNHPAPANGGSSCPGSGDQTQSCNVEKCPAQPGTKDNPGGSCNSLKGNNKNLKSGKFWVNLGKPTEVYCDMESGEGGWLMVGQAAIDDESQKEEIAYHKLLSNDLTRLGEVTSKRFLLGTDALRDLQRYTKFKQIRFYCTKPYHGRIVDIATKTTSNGPLAVQLMLERTRRLVHSCHSYDRLPDDTSRIGQHCEQWYDEFWNDQGRRSKGAKLYDFPFYINEYKPSLFSLYNGYRLLCDDNNGYKVFRNVGTWRFYVR